MKQNLHIGQSDIQVFNQPGRAPTGNSYSPKRPEYERLESNVGTGTNINVMDLIAQIIEKAQCHNRLSQIQFYVAHKTN